jgi:hypothetical protein
MAEYITKLEKAIKLARKHQSNVPKGDKESFNLYYGLICGLENALMDYLECQKDKSA